MGEKTASDRARRIYGGAVFRGAETDDMRRCARVETEQGGTDMPCLPEGNHYQGAHPVRVFEMAVRMQLCRAIRALGA